DRKRDHAIRRALTEGAVRSTDSIARFVGLEAYEQAGGYIKSDLFQDVAYLENPEILQRLATEKLQAEAEKLSAEGWAWVESAVNQDWKFTNRCDQLEPEPVEAPKELTDQQAALKAELEAIEQEWDDADENDEDLLNAIRKKDAETT